MGETTEETASGLPSRFGLIFSYAGENFGFPIFNSPSNPGGMIGVEFSLSGKRGYAYIQCINLGYVYHIGLLHSLFLNTLCYMKWWIKDQATIGVYLGAGIIDVFYEGEKYVFDDGMYKKAEFTFGNIYPYFPFGLSLGYDLSRITVVPLEVVLRYECSIQIGFHEAVPAMLHVAFYGGFVWHF
ncbi:MAG: hypothetical protein JW881_10725 [Spirochaetales bacterium]|nr:hypothetical protein [Spirochaetales bacterium]